MCCRRPSFCIYLGLNCELVLCRSPSLGLRRTYLLLLCIKTRFMLVMNYGNIGGRLFPGVLFVTCLLSWSSILMMNMQSLLGRWPGEGLNLRFSISFMFLLVSLHGLVFVSSKTAFSIFASCIAFGLLHTCACNALCCNMSISFDIISLQSLAAHFFY